MKSVSAAGPRRTDLDRREKGRPLQKLGEEPFTFSGLPPEGVDLTVKVRASGPVHRRRPDQRASPDTGRDAAEQTEDRNARAAAGAVPEISDLCAQVVRVRRGTDAVNTRVLNLFD